MNKSDQRPISPFLIGPYYRPQLTSMLSISFRLGGIFLTAITAPLMAIYMLVLAAGPGPYERMTAIIGSLPGQALGVISVFFICYHMANGIRHMLWDTGNFLELRQVYATGYVMVVCAVTLFSIVMWGIYA